MTTPYTWFQEQATTYEIQTNDMTLVSQQNSVIVNDIIVSTNSPGSCSDSFTPVLLKNPCQEITPGVHTVISCPTGSGTPTVDLNGSSINHNPGVFSDSVSTSNGDPTFCGERQFTFVRLNTGGDASDLVTVLPSGDWQI